MNRIFNEELDLEFETLEKERVIGFALRLIPNLSPHLDFRDKVRIAKFNYYLLPRLKTFTERKGPYEFIFSLNRRHIDTPMEFSIQIMGNRIATINFYFIQRNNQIELHINNLQGLKGSPNQTQNYYLTKLSEKLGENWRIYIIKRIKQFCENNNLKIIGELPTRFYMIDTPLSTDHEYKRQLRQYIQAYLKAGVSLEDIHYDLIEPETLDWIRNNLKIKGERLEGKRPVQRTEPKRKAKIQAKRPMA
jgi:hypothetical protein